MRERDAARLLLGAFCRVDVGRACNNIKWFGRKGSVARGTRLVVYMRVTAGVASVDTPRPQIFLHSESVLNSIVCAGGQYDCMLMDRAALAAYSIISCEYVPGLVMESSRQLYGSWMRVWSWIMS